MKRLGFLFGVSAFSALGSAQAIAQQASDPSRRPMPPAMQVSHQHVGQAPSLSGHPPGAYPYGAGVDHGAPETACATPSGCENAGCGGGANCSHGPSAFWTAYYRNVHWPSPFKIQDLNAVTSYFDIQRENGWKLHNTLGNALFDPQTNCLTDSGKRHIHSILADAPAHRRAVFVLQGESPHQTAQRVESVQLAISTYLPTGELPPIYLTDRDAPGSPGTYQIEAYRHAVVEALKGSGGALPGSRFQVNQNLGQNSSP